jgi:membrane protease subunit HflK
MVQARLHARGLGETLRDMAESSMRKVVGDHSVSEIPRIGREAIRCVPNRSCKRCATAMAGGFTSSSWSSRRQSPKPVRESFNEVNQAIQERQRSVNQAWGYNSVIPKARGSALQTVQTAEGYATERVNRARGDVARFLSLQQEYAKAPAVTRSRLYLETMGEVLPRAQNRIFIDDRLKRLLPLFPLDGGNRNRPPGASSTSDAADRSQP